MRGLWKFIYFFFATQVLWWFFSEFEDCRSSETKPCLKPSQTWETSRFREAECQGLTEGSSLDSYTEMKLTVKTLSRLCTAQARKYVSLCLWESQAGDQSPELFKVLWSCKWRSIPLLSGTFLFAMVRPCLDHKRVWNLVPWGPRMDTACVSILLLLLRSRQMERWRMALFTTLVIPTWKRHLNTGYRKTLGALWTYRNCQKRWCKILS